MYNSNKCYLLDNSCNKNESIIVINITYLVTNATHLIIVLTVINITYLIIVLITMKVL